MRLHKYLANAGIGSRRAIEEMIKLGKIKVNDRIAELGQQVTSKDTIQVENKFVTFSEVSESIPPRVLIYNKPEGEICSQSTKEVKQTVFDHLPKLHQGRWVMVGRLDVNTSGLLIFTNDGELAHRLMHPRFKLDRQYAVRVIGNVTDNIIARLKKGVPLPDTGFCRFKDMVPRASSSGLNQWFTVTLGEGKYREVRQLFASQNCTVSRLIRIKYGNIALPKDLKKGCWRELSPEEVTACLL